MSLRKREKLEYPAVFSNFNLTNELDPSHSIGSNTNFFHLPTFFFFVYIYYK